MKVVLASNNAGKVREFKELFKSLPIELIPQAELGVPDADETGLSFIENALIKARHATNLTGLPAIADDSGLAVDALKGAPGIYSARYAGMGADSAAHIKKLLDELKDVPKEKRTASFHCVLVFMTHGYDPMPIICDGAWQGSILSTPSGEKGFGYDPVFYVPTEKKSAAELSIELKNKISHRGIALQCLINQLSQELKKA